MWSTGTFVSEMGGTLVFVFMSLFMVLASKSSIIALKEREKRFFVAIGIGISLVIAKVVALGIANVSGVQEFGYLNSGVALAHAIAIDDFQYLLPSVLGEVAGAFGASLLVLVIFLGAFSKSPVAFKDAKEAFAFLEDKNPVPKIAAGELLASFLFVATAITIIFLANEAIIIIGLAFTIILLTFGLRFNLILNIFATIMPVLVGTCITKPSPRKLIIYLKGFTAGTIFNLGASGILGAFYLGLS